MNLENLDSVVDLIIENNLIEKNECIGIGVSGGSDSMALLHFLHSISEPLEIEIVAVHVNHNLRPTSRKDAAFVSKFCKQNNIKYLGYNVDVQMHARQYKMSIEQSARIKRYECYEDAIKKYKLNKFAIAHHQGDQAETILMHIFRGSGIAGARGMDLIRETSVKPERGAPATYYIRPFLETPKTDIVAYNYRNQVPSIEDESNEDDRFTRNFIRNQIIPSLQTQWRGVIKNIVDFGRNCKTDDSYLNSIVEMNSLLGDENHIRIPLNYFAYPYPVISRIILSAFEQIRARENIEKKHIDMIITLALSGENGSQADLPNDLYAIREYEYMSLVRKIAPVASKIYSFKIGKTVFAEYGTIIVTKTISHKDAVSRGLMVIDTDKLPRASKWRTRKDSDTFTKFGGGTKSLNAWMIDRKIPARMRDRIPILAHGNEVYAVANYEISDKVKTDRETIEAFVLEFIKD